MAKKKKSSKKKVAEEPLEASPFWPLAGAFILVILGLFLLLGGFGTGGSLPVGMFHAAYWLFGWAAYFVPFVLVYWGVAKFRIEGHHLAGSKIAGLVAFLAFAAGLFDVMFA